MASPTAETFRRFTRSVFGAQAALLKHGDEANADFGQSSARWRVMQRISAGQKSVADIARSTGYSRQAVQRLADALVAEGSARYFADESDRRRQCLELTPAGTAVFGQLEANFDIWADRLMAHIPAAELMATAKTLEHIRLILLADCDYMKRKRSLKCQARRSPSAPEPIEASASK
jgi:DNA-binding MarR family transcriptional regulator